MYWLALAAYLLAGAGLLWWLLFGRVRGITSRPKVRSAFDPPATLSSRCGRAIPIVATVLGLTFPALLAIHLVSDHREMASILATENVQRNAVALAVLSDHERVAPMPPPPDVFTTREVEKLRPGTALANRDWSRLQPELQQRLLEVFSRMESEHGYRMVLLEGYRSPARQASLRNGPVTVTGVGPGRSYHQYGLAADCAFYRDGKLVISEKDDWALTGYRLFGDLAEEVGLTWGGRWKLRDFGHVEWRDSGYPDPRNPADG